MSTVTTVTPDGGGDSGPGIDVILPPDLEDVVAQKLAQAVSEKVVERIWQRDPTVWGSPDLPEIGDRLGWLSVSDTLREHAEELLAFAEELRSEGYTDLVLLGMGGSSLGPEVIRRSFGDKADGLRLRVLDSTHPDAVVAVEESIDLAKTIFIVSSKSGTTVEMLAHYRYFKAKAGPQQFIVITDPGSPLAAIAEADGLRRTFLNPSDIGGRYSVMSYFGMVPAALAGVSIDALLRRSKVAEDACSPLTPVEQNIGLRIGVTIGELAVHGRDKLTFQISEPIDSFALWVEQLIAESTGKQGKGILPVVDEPIGDPSAYGDDRAFIYMRHGNRPSQELDAAFDALLQTGHPTITQTTFNAAGLGRLFFVFEFAVAVAGWVLGINPFDQPNVQEAKDTVSKLLSAGSTPDIPSADDAALKALLADAKPPHYVAIVGYLPTVGRENQGIDEAIRELRTAIRSTTGAATTFGYGPRFQHSTGQEHKGGAPVGRFLQLVNKPKETVPIPGEQYDFGMLLAAASAADLQTLRDHQLPAERVLLKGEPARAIRELAARITALLGDG